MNDANISTSISKKMVPVSFFKKYLIKLARVSLSDEQKRNDDQTISFYYRQ